MPDASIQRSSVRQLHGKGLLGGVILLIACALPARALEPQAVADAAYGAALYEFYQDRYFAAIVRLEAALQRQQLDADRPAGELLRAGLLLAYQLPRSAAAAFADLLDAGQPQVLRDEIWLRLGRSAHLQGDAERAADALSRVSAAAPLASRAEVRLRLGMLALARGQNTAALEWLRPETVAEAPLTPYIRYNRAVALTAAGQADTALIEFDRLGRADGADAELREIADRANLAAAYQLLGRADPAAEDYFRRIRLQGAAAEMALLGAGWSAAGRGDYAAALGPWQRLLAGEATAAPVLEARLAVAFAKARLGAEADAEADYLAAIEHYERQLRALDQARAAVAAPAFAAAIGAVGGDHAYGDTQAAVAALSELRGAGFHAGLWAGAGFQRQLSEHLELLRLRDGHARQAKDFETFATMLATRQARFAAVLPTIRERLGQIDRDALRQRRGELDVRLQQAAQADVWALASASERKARADIYSLQQRARDLPSSPQRRAMVAKLQRLQGVLEWQVDAAFIERRWQARKQLRALDAEFARLDGHWQALSAAEATAETTLARLYARLQAQHARWRSLGPGLETALASSETALRELVSARLAAQQQLLRDYLRQARFGLAELYDGSLAAAGAAR